MPAEIFFAYPDPAATPLLGDLLVSARFISSGAPLPAELDPLVPTGALKVSPSHLGELGDGVAARLYADGEDVSREAEELLRRGHQVRSLPTLGPPGPSVPCGPLFARRILVTRPSAQAGTLLSALRLRGALPSLLPAVRIAPPVDDGPAEAALQILPTFRYMVLTSQNAVDAFFEALDARGADIRQIGGAHLLAVGAATAARLQARGLQAEVGRTGTALGLAEQLAGRTAPGERALVLGPDPPDEELLRALRDIGLAADAAPLYRTVAGASPGQVAQVLAAPRPDAVLFHSPSAVRATLAALPSGHLRAVPAVAIGPRTADACRTLGLAVAAVAAEPSLSGVLLALRTALGTEPVPPKE